MERRVSRELLDQLPPTDPTARRSRRDLRLVNRLMRNNAILRRTLSACLPASSDHPWRVLEAGAGDGMLAAQIWPRLPSPPSGSQLMLLDRLPVVETDAMETLAAHGWVAEVLVTDIHEWIDPFEPRSLDLLYANLFVHHFDGAELSALLSAIAARANWVVFLEPRRSAVALLGARLLGCLGCNSITRHDAVRSVEAGFQGREITSLWPDPARWSLTESAAGLFGHCFVAQRRITS